MRTLLSMLVVVGVLSPALAGSLTPPGGAAGPTMKDLDDVEPRIAINAANTPGDPTATHRIAAPGSYYLTNNVLAEVGKAGILISASNVTIDLNGFAMIGMGSGDRAITASGVQSGVVIKNGRIDSWLDSGIGLTASGIEVRVSDVTVSNCTWLGIACGPSSIVERCIVEGCARDGILVGEGSRVIDCLVRNNGANGARPGISVGARSIVTGCSSHDNAGDGLLSGQSCVIQNCTSTNNGGEGIEVAASSTVSRCTTRENGAGGVLCTGVACLVESVTSELDMGVGITTQDGSAVRGCVVQASASDGILAGQRCQVHDCNASNNIGNGIVVGFGSWIASCFASQNMVSGFETSFECVVAECGAFANGRDGIDVRVAALVDGCSVRGNGRVGISAESSCVIVDSIADCNGSDGIFGLDHCVVRSCVSTSNDATGIRTGNSVIDGCTVLGSMFDGIRAAGVIRNNTSRFNTENGIEVLSHSLVVGNACEGNGFSTGVGAGIRVDGMNTRVESNNLSANDLGLQVVQTGNFIAGNTVSGSATAYDIVGGNTVGQIFDFTGGGAITNSVVAGNGVWAGPWSNFIY